MIFKMWLRVYTCILALCLLLAPALASVCPDGCVCITTRDGLHRATCSSLSLLYKFTLRQKHYNINILDLSHNNITKLSHELDRLTEVVTLDLSTNGITTLNKFLHNARKLVHLNLANNRIQQLSLTHLPTSVSSLDLTNNLLHDVPSDLDHLSSLEHLELEGNPLHCSCENIMARDRLLLKNVFIDSVTCASPAKIKGSSWLELKIKDICKVPKTEPNYLDMMMGDQPFDAVRIGEQTSALKSMSQVVDTDLNVGEVIPGPVHSEDDDSSMFMKVSHSTSSPEDVFEGSGSGDVETATLPSIIEPKQSFKHIEDALKVDEVLRVDQEHTSEQSLEGSGQGSGSGEMPIIIGDGIDYADFTETTEAATTTPIKELHPGPVVRLINDDENESSTEFPMPKAPSVYKGDPDWYLKTNPPVTPEPVTPIARDTTISEHIRVTQASENLGAAPTTTEKIAPHKTGTYVCIAIIVVLLVGLIGFAIVKGQMRKRRDRRLLRQQKRDVEKASKEMVDMNKSLLGKPAGLEPAIEKKVNGKYELVPTHDAHQKKSENGDIGNGKYNETNEPRTDSPRDTNQNKSSSKDNNLSEDNQIPQQETSFESDLASPDSRKDTNSLSSEDIFVPMNDEDTPRLNGNLDSDISQPLINGDQNTDSDFLSPSREYVPVYSPDMGRVRIKMAETPKPKTPVLVTRSRSNAGDIIITPMDDSNARKSTT